MTPSEPPKNPGASRREWAFVAAMTAVGLLVRIWGLGGLGLVHFDEGIYAVAGYWPLTPAGMTPMVVPYAPAGFPFLVGLSYLILGPSDLAAILVSVATGALAVPATAWLARRTFGPGAGAVASALVALSGFHVAFSRMALTDATFLLCWVVGLAIGQRFLERPGAASALLLGAATGVAQLVKYSGWTLGVAVMLTAAAIAAFDPSRRVSAYQKRVWGWGLLAAATAALAYAPWFRFVEANGGYAALMAHHRGYLGTAGSWLSHWAVQLEQMGRLSGGPTWGAFAWAAALAGAAVSRGGFRPTRPGWLGIGVLTVASVAAPTTFWWLGLALVAAPGRDASPGLRLLGVAWAGLSILTPFYHPYARLWLPLQALGWIAAAGVLCDLLDPHADPKALLRRRRLPLAVAACAAALVQALVLFGAPARHGADPGILAPSDSLRRATARALADLPEDASGLRVLARPPVTFYLAGRGGARPEPDAAGLIAGGGAAWALVDLAQLRQSGDPGDLEARLLRSWEKVGEYPMTLNLPTLLDVELGAAVVGRGASEAPLWLLGPKSGGPR